MERRDLDYPYEHAAGGETSLLMAIRPDLVDLKMTLETDGILMPSYSGQPEHLRRRGETKNKHIGVFTDMDDGANDPELAASFEREKLLLDTISKRIAERAWTLLHETS